MTGNDSLTLGVSVTNLTVNASSGVTTLFLSGDLVMMAFSFTILDFFSFFSLCTSLVLGLSALSGLSAFLISSIESGEENCGRCEGGTAVGEDSVSGVEGEMCVVSLLASSDKLLYYIEVFTE